VGMPEPTLVETDDQGQTVLPGHPNRRFVQFSKADGSIVLRPVLVVSDAEAQHEYDTNPELRELLARAMAGKTVHGNRTRRPRS
jgi:hypothetical protein